MSVEGSLSLYGLDGVPCHSYFTHPESGLSPDRDTVLGWYVRVQTDLEVISVHGVGMLLSHPYVTNHVS